MPAPSYPWVKGQHPDHTVFVIEVEVAVDQFGVPWSNHKLQDEDDYALVRDMQSGGMEQCAQALIGEAVKREALLEVLLKMSNDPEFRARLFEESPETQGALVHEISAAILEVFRRATLELAPEAARAALDMVRSDPRDV